MNLRNVSTVAVGIAVAGLLATFASVRAQIKQPTADYASGVYLFRTFCASCHGVSGKGDGPIAGALRVATPISRGSPREPTAFFRGPPSTTPSTDGVLSGFMGLPACRSGATRCVGRRDRTKRSCGGASTRWSSTSSRSRQGASHDVLNGEGHWSVPTATRWRPDLLVEHPIDLHGDLPQRFLGIGRRRACETRSFPANHKSLLRSTAAGTVHPRHQAFTAPCCFLCGTRIEVDRRASGVPRSPLRPSTSSRSDAVAEGLRRARSQHTPIEPPLEQFCCGDVQRGNRDDGDEQRAWQRLEPEHDDEWQIRDDDRQRDQSHR
jgi:hypothetical protein